ncbi:zinc-dependent alcohol dehydrogenase [Paenibacillus silvisoli]|uniref:zinc-dependent alcohol dehydrogenase n=1 Tax=Paenibacillus silvisoli TaxID=3110539 RepID=UPI0028047979|nr:alcohol dehydrogenase catalytic domain-containing protein [Paenibacillus silvisoli]
MRALVWKESGKVEHEADWPQPGISDDEILVRVKAAGVCMTDIHMMRGTLDFANPPWVLGHEMSGVIEQTGKNTTGWKIGDRVIIDPVVTCGYCKHCLTGKKYLCASGGELGTTYGSGGYGQYVSVKPSNLYLLPDELGFEEGAMMEPLNCTLGAIDRVSKMAGSHVLIFGPGPAGLLFVQLAKAYGALSVTLVGMRDVNLSLGQQLGADYTVNITSASIEEALEGKEFDVVIEASGSVDGVQGCFTYVGRSGTVVLYGLNGSKKPSIDSDMIVAKDLTIVTCISAPLLWNKGIDLVKSGRVNVKDIITHLVPYAEAREFINAIGDKSFSTTKMVFTHE